MSSATRATTAGTAFTRATVVLGCTTALMLLPALTGSAGFSYDGFSHHAYAKGEGGGKGGGNGGGNGGGKGGGNAGGNGGGHGAGKGGGQGAGRSAAKTGDRGGVKGLGGLFGGGVSAAQGNDKSKAKGAAKSQMAAVSAKDAGRKTGKVSLAKQQQAALKGKSVPVPSFKDEVKEKNLHAKLGGLNSLKRNYNAYLNANDPKFAAIQGYVMASANFDLTEAELAEATAALAAADAEFDAALGAIQPHDDFSYTADLTTADLESRLGELEAIDPTTLDAETAAALSAEIGALDAALDSAVAVSEAEQQVADLEAKQAEQQEAVSDDALMAALQAGANPNREVDQEMVDWAKDVLGVGETYGKIDQVREALQAETTEPVDPTEPVEPAEPIEGAE